MAKNSFRYGAHVCRRCHYFTEDVCYLMKRDKTGNVISTKRLTNEKGTCDEFQIAMHEEEIIPRQCPYCTWTGLHRDMKLCIDRNLEGTGVYWSCNQYDCPDCAAVILNNLSDDT